MILVFIETNFWIWCGYLTLRKTLSSKKKISGFYVCQLIYLVKTSSNLSLSRHTSWWICPISLDLEVPMELHHYNQCNYILCVILWSTQHARIMSGIILVLSSSLFSKQCQHLLTLQNASSVVTLADERAFLNFFWEWFNICLRFNLPKGSWVCTVTY